jgi:hypothetical protein
MIATALAGTPRAGLLALALLFFTWPAAAQQPSANAIALAKEIVIVKGAVSIYEPIVGSVVDRAKQLLLQTNPMLGKDLNEVAAKLHAEFAPRSSELINDAAKLYAAKFTEQELKEVLAFYKSAVGRKIITQESLILEQSIANADAWSDRISTEVLSKFRAEMRKRGHEI